MADYDRAEEAFHFLEKEKLSKTNSKNLYLEKAYYFQVRGDYNNMVNNLSKADSLLSRKDRKGRIYFIVGQVYQKLGFNSEAYNFYRKCVATNPEYEIDFYARLNMAQVAQLDSKRDIRTVRKQFDKLLKDVKNQEFKDKIYFELGEFEKKQSNLKEAIDQYKLAAHAGKNKRIQGMAFLRIGQINFDSLKKYKPAKAYYDSAVNSLPKDLDGLDGIKKRQALLVEFVKHTETITLNDSLLTLAAMDTSRVRHLIDSIQSAKEKKLAGTKKKKKKPTSQDSGPSTAPTSIAFGGAATDDTNTGDWYFGNKDLVATGQNEFSRIWGNIPLEDNWRRSNRSVSATETATNTVAQSPETNPEKKNEKSTEEKKEAKVDVAAQLIAQLPNTEAKQKEALAKIENAYFKLGDLYYFNLNEKDNAAESYEKLVARFPTSELMPEVLYKLYLIHKEKNDGLAEGYAKRLQGEFPTSTFAKILVNPDYLKEISALAEKQKLQYKEAYAYFQKNNLRPALEITNQALASGETSFTPQLELLKILLTGKTEDVTRYQYELGEFVKKYPKDPLSKYAGQLLASSKALYEKIEKAKGIVFGTNFNNPHFFIVIYNEAERITNPVVDALEKFNQLEWTDLKLTTSNLGFADGKVLTMCVELPDKATAMRYYDKFLAQLAGTKPFSNYKFYNFVITKDNFQIFYRTKSLDEYLTFFDKNYQK
jgi:tetratricopeptide (TPR) repeat protein